MSFKLNVYFFPILVLLASCKDSNSTKETSELNKSKKEDNKGVFKLEYIETNKVKFEYKIIDSIETVNLNGNTFTEKYDYLIGKVTNKEEKELYIVGYYCSSFYRLFDQNKKAINSIQFTNCNISYPFINVLRSEQSLNICNRYESKSLERNEKIGITFLTVNKFLDEETLRNNPELLKKAQNECYNNSNIVWGSILK